LSIIPSYGIISAPHSIFFDQYETPEDSIFEKKGISRGIMGFLDELDS
jgi:hypothetical protein